MGTNKWGFGCLDCRLAAISSSKSKYGGDRKLFVPFPNCISGQPFEGWHAPGHVLKGGSTFTLLLNTWPLSENVCWLSAQREVGWKRECVSSGNHSPPWAQGDSLPDRMKSWNSFYGPNRQFTSLLLVHGNILGLSAYHRLLSSHSNLLPSSTLKKQNHNQKHYWLGNFPFFQTQPPKPNRCFFGVIYWKQKLPSLVAWP